ncbi:MAG: HD domain-containing protein [Patescibacteria group bacterium]
MKYKIPEEIKRIYDTLKNAGYETYLVGGCVRDLLLGKKPKDWDITTNARPEKIEKLYEKSFYENQFGTVSAITDSEDETLKVVEITPYRLESKYSDKRHPDAVKFTGKLEDDLKRRDFTVNAMALNLETQTGSVFPVSGFMLYDFFGGQEDLKKAVIRAVGEPTERFEEDALRIMRAVRLAAELDFSIEEKTSQAIKEKGELLDIIAKERIKDELVKIIMSDRPQKGLESMRETGILKYVLPELEEGWGVTQNKEHIFKVWEHNLRSLEHAVKNNYSLEIRMAALLHDVGKPRAKRGEGPDSTFYSHDVIGGKMAKEILFRLKFSKKFTETVSKLVRYHLFFSDTDVITLSAVRRLVRNVGPENIWDLIKVRFCDRMGMGRPKERPFRLRKYQAMVEQVLRDPISVKMLKINGNRLMKITNLEPGPKIGDILNILLEDVLDDPELNTAEYLENKAKELAVLPDQELKKLSKEAKKKSITVEEEVIGEIKGKYYVK